MQDKKVVSLLAAGTEIICALGLEDRLVGISHECDYPESIRNLPVCSSVNFAPGKDSAEIDRKVKELLSDALSIYGVNKELISQLQPDLVITQSQCEVCAVSLKDVEDALSTTTGKQSQVISFQPNMLDDIYGDILTVAAAMGFPERGTELLESLRERMDLIRHKLKFIETRPNILMVEWMSPLMIAGNWIPELVEIAGGNPVLGLHGRHSPYIDYEEVRTANPDIIVITPCGFSIQRTLEEIGILNDLPGWNDLKAVQNGRVYVADGNHYFNRSGPRIVDSAEILAEIIYPKQFVFGYEGTGWLKFG